MVVLEEGSMLTTGHNQYLQPDYLSPLPTTLDAKKSPLALLAQTCSQIGADTPSKLLLSPLDKPSKGSSAASHARSPPAAKLERTRGSPSDGLGGKSSSSGASLAFKPYETNVVVKREDSSHSSRPGSKASSVHSASGNPDSASNSASAESPAPKKSSSRSTPVGRKSASPGQQLPATSAAEQRDKTSASPKAGGASPVVRSGLEVLAGHSGKDAAAAAAAAAANLQSMYKAGLAGFGAGALCCPPGLAENPAFRPPFAGASAFSQQQAAAAAALLGYPGAASPGAGPYLGYARVKTPAGGETLVPVCKDPYCTGCQYSMHSAQMMMAAAAAAAAAAAGAPAGACPGGCTQCDHQKYGLMALSALGPVAPPAPLAAAGYPGALSAGGRPHVCNWIAGESYCGKRFATSEELLQHLRGHASLAGAADPSAAAALLAAGQHPHSLLSPTAALHRAAAAAAQAAAGPYPAPSLSPLGGRYHPYGKPPAGPLPASLAAGPYGAFGALGPYYSPYAIYGQRIGAAVHP